MVIKLLMLYKHSRLLYLSAKEIYLNAVGIKHVPKGYSIDIAKLINVSLIKIC